METKESNGGGNEKLKPFFYKQGLISMEICEDLKVDNIIEVEVDNLVEVSI
jgi:hypothetical protein